MTIEIAERTLDFYYEEALKNEHIEKPVAYALYHTWRAADLDKENTADIKARRNLKIGDPVFFVFADSVLENGWYIAEEKIFDISVRGIYVKANDDPEDEDVNFFLYGDESTFFSRAEAEVVLQQRIKEYKESERNA